MSVAHIFVPENRLAAILGKADDLTAAALVERAERSLEAVRLIAKGYVVTRLKLIERLAEQAESQLLAESHSMGAAALEVCEVAAAAHMPMVGEAARALYIMVSAQKYGVWRTDALKLHIQALLLINADGLSTEDAQSLLERLEAVRERVGVPA